jgi:PIN domain nuclease of toxin-antitoxin system
MSPILLDTHAALWSAGGTIASDVRHIIDAAAKRSELLLSPITAWEVGMLVRKQRLSLTTTAGDFVRALFSQPGALTAPVTPAIAVAAAGLPDGSPADPADRILIATASAYGARLVTRDRSILDYAKATRLVRCVAC